MAVEDTKETSFNIGTDYPVTIENKDEMKKKVSTYKDGMDVTNYLADLGWEYLDKQIIIVSFWYILCIYF